MSMDLYDPSAPTTTSDINLTSAAAPSTNDAVTPDHSNSAVLSDKGGADSSATVVDHASLSFAAVQHVAAAPHDALLDQSRIVITESCARDAKAGNEDVSPSKSNAGCDFAATLSQMLPQQSSSVVATEIAASDAVPNSGGCVKGATFSSVSHHSPSRQLDANGKGEGSSSVILQEANPTSSVMHPPETSETLAVNTRPKRSPSVSDEDLVPSGIRSRRKSSSSPARSSSRDRHSRGHRSRSSPLESKARSTDHDSAKQARSPESESRNSDRRDRRRDESRGRSPVGRDDRRRPNQEDRRPNQEDRRHSETEYRKRGNFEDKRPYRRDDRSHNAQGYRRPANESGRHAEGPEGRRHNTGYDRKRADREERTDAERSARSGRREWRSPPSHFKQRPPSYGDFDRQGNAQHRQKRDGAASRRDSRPQRSRSGSPVRRQSRSPARRQSRSPARRQSRSPTRRQSRDYDAQRRGSSPDNNRSACSNGALQRKSSPLASAKAETVTSNRLSTAGRCEPSRSSPSAKPAIDRVVIAPRRSGVPLIVADHPSSAVNSTEASGHANSSRRIWPDADGRMVGADESRDGSGDDHRGVQPSSDRTVAEPPTGLAASAESGSTREPAIFAGDSAAVFNSGAHAAASNRLQPSVSPVYRDVPASQTFEAPKNFPPADVARSFSFSELMRLPPPPLPPPSLIMPLASCAPMPMTMGPMQPSMPTFAPGIHGGVLPPHSAGLPPPLTSLGITLTPLGVPPPPLGVPPPPPLSLLPPTMPGMQLPMPFIPRPGLAPHLSSASAQPPFALPQFSVGGRQPFVHALAGPPLLPQASQPSPAVSHSSGVRGIDRLVGVHSGGIVAESHRQQQHPDHASTVPASPPPPPELFLGKQNGDDAVKARSNLIVIRTEDAVENAGKVAENKQHSRNDRYSSADDMTEAPMDMAADDDDDDDDDAAFVAPPSKGLMNGKWLSDKSSPQKNETQQAEPTGQAAGSSNVVDVYDSSQADRALDSNHAAEPPQPPQRTIEVLQQLQQLLSRGSSVPGQDAQAKADMHSGVLGAVLAGKASSNDEPADEALQKKMKKAAVGHVLNVKDASPGSDIPSSATELSNQRVIEKMNRQERIAEEIKVVLKPYYRAGKISKLEYKEIMKKAVHKIYNSKSGAINPSKVKAFVDGYVTKTIQMQKLLKKRQHVQT